MGYIITALRIERAWGVGGLENALTRGVRENMVNRIAGRRVESDL